MTRTTDGQQTLAAGWFPYTEKEQNRPSASSNAKQNKQTASEKLHLRKANALDRAMRDADESLSFVDLVELCNRGGNLIFKFRVHTFMEI